MRKRLSAALLFSLLAHLALLWWFVRAAPPPLPTPPAPIRAQIVQLPPREVPPEPEPEPAPRSTPVRKSRPRPEPEAPTPPPEQGEDELARANQGAPGALPPGAPRRIDLSPPPLGAVSDGPAGSGQTLFNHPETPEEHAAAMAEEAARVKGRVDGWVVSDVGEARVRLGLVDSYFGSIRGALQKAVERGAPDGMPGQNVGQQLLGAVLGGADLYGKTGNPYGEGQVPNAAPAEREFLGHAEEMRRRYPGSQMPKGSDPRSMTTEQFQQCVERGKMLDDFLSGKFGGGVVAVVELSQAPDGKLLEAKLVQPSNLPAFDRHVMEIAPAALADLPPPPDRGFGIKQGAGLKSLWRFEGRVKFKRPLKEWNLFTGSLTGTLVGALYGLACPGLGPPITFDAATGQFELIDLAHPKFTCQVKLLRIE